MITPSIKNRFPSYGYLGVAIILVAEALLFAGNDLVGHWFTPIVWTGFVLVADAMLFKVAGRSLLQTDRLELLIIAVVSIGCWWLFEWYNAPRFWKSNLEIWWHYHNLEPNLSLRRVGYDWAFATISPAMFVAAELFALTLFKRQTSKAKLRLPGTVLILILIAGLAGAVLPLLFPSGWFAPVVWLAFVFFLDPINYLRAQPSILGDLSRGDWRRLWALLTSGFVCGVLWEFWNYWAISRWTYTVPFLGDIKIFEMPVLGFLGFPPFAVECWVMYIFLRSLLQPAPAKTDSADIYVRAS